MSTTAVSLTLSPAIEARIKELVASGRYADANEVIAEGLRLLDERDKLERLRAEIAIGLEEIERGEEIVYTPDYMQRLIRKADEDERNEAPLVDAVLP